MSNRDEHDEKERDTGDSVEGDNGGPATVVQHDEDDEGLDGELDHVADGEDDEEGVLDAGELVGVDPTNPQASQADPRDSAEISRIFCLGIPDILLRYPGYSV